MALKLNIYRTIPGVTTASATTIYTAPTGYTGVVLLVNVANIGTTTRTVSLFHRRPTSLGGFIDTSIAEGFPIPKNDAINLVDGKLFLQTGDSLVIQGPSSGFADLEYVVSILETLN